MLTLCFSDYFIENVVWHIAVIIAIREELNFSMSFDLLFCFVKLHLQVQGMLPLCSTDNFSQRLSIQTVGRLRNNLLQGTIALYLAL
ncbi:MAG TPA: hypothetical protein DDZ88_19020 [Verrucomicrobiales bacterium]|nr:hypothetical protein [Verrucomicrobiales bacterium]